MILIDQGRDDEVIVAELRRSAGGRRAGLVRAALWLRCAGRADEHRREHRAHQLLQAAISEPAASEAAASESGVPPVSETDQRRLGELEQLRAFAVLAARDHRLDVLAGGLTPTGDPRPDDLGVEGSEAGWLALSPTYALGQLRRVPVLRRRIPRPVIDLVDRLDELVGPSSATTDRVLSSHTALAVAVEHCVDLLYPTMTGDPHSDAAS